MSRQVAAALAAALAGLLAASCGGSDSDDAEVQGTDFLFQSRDWPASEQFVVRIADAHAVEAARAELERPLSERQLFPNGRLHAGRGGHNLAWRWHLRDVHYGAVAIELCDGRPSMVEANLDEWLQRVQRFCPWSARVIAELR